MARLTLIFTISTFLVLVAAEADPKPAADPVPAADPAPAADPDPAADPAAAADPDASPDAEASPSFKGGHKGSRKCYGKTHVVQKYITKYNKAGVGCRKSQHLKWFSYNYL